MSYRIGSFNLLKLSYQSDKEIKKNFELIAEIMKNEQMDIIAIQEVNTPDPIDNLILPRLGRNWARRWKQPKRSVSAQAAEGYAFLWNQDKFGLPTQYVHGTKRVYEPRIIDQYQKHGYDELIRNPLYGRFTPVGLGAGPYVEFRLINAHIRFGKNEQEEACPGAVTMRKREFQILAGSIYSKVADRVYGSADGEAYTPLNQPSPRMMDCNGMPSYTILLGDYNLNLKRPWTHSAYLPVDEKDELVAYDGRRIVTVQDQLTTLKKESEGDSSQEKNEQKYANNYDHFSYDKIRMESHLDITYRHIDAVQEYTGNDFALYRRTVSDHIPIVMEIDIKR